MARTKYQDTYNTKDFIDESMEKKKTYKLEVKCVNCGYWDIMEIPYGEQVVNQICLNCGCKTLKKRIDI